MAQASRLASHAPRPHALHAADRIWPETNCYVDQWIELLNAFGHVPQAALSFTVEQDFEGDQFTFFKFPLEDLEALYGLKVQALAIFHSVEAHAGEQHRRGRLVLVEVDGYYLPDTRGTSYRTQHTKTTVGIVGLDVETRRMDYFHNAGFYTVEGDDFDAIFRRVPELKSNPDILFPYVEFVKQQGPRLQGPALLDASLDLLRQRLRNRPAENPLAAYGSEFPRHQERLADSPLEYFHLYAFNTLRQLGANFELLGRYARWLAAQQSQGAAGSTLEGVRTACIRIAESAKALQFQLARAVARRRSGDNSAVIDQMKQAYDTAIGGLVRLYG